MFEKVDKAEKEKINGVQHQSSVYILDRNIGLDNKMAAPSASVSFQVKQRIFAKLRGVLHRHPPVLVFSRYSTSSDSNSDADEVEDIDSKTKHRIFRASLAFVPEFGWSKKTLTHGAEVAGYPRLAHGMFPNGPADLIHFFYQDCNSQLGDILRQNVEKLTEMGEKPKTKEFVRNAVEIRLRMLVPYIDKWPQAMAVQMLPQNAVQSWSNLSDLVDEIWYHAGDRSTDFNWYTKRMSLAAVYKSTEITMVQDKSEDFLDTWSFLDRRLDNLVNFGKTIRQAQNTNNEFSDVCKGTLIMARNVLGMNNRFR